MLVLLLLLILELQGRAVYTFSRMYNEVDADATTKSEWLEAMRIPMHFL